MAEISPLPVQGAVFLDPRDDGRSLRVSWHPEIGRVVLSIWRDDICAATVQLPVGDVPDLVRTLVDGLTRLPATPTDATQRRPA